MTSDELLNMLDGAGKPLVTERVSPFIRAAEANLFKQVAARIRELKTALKECDRINEDQAARIRELLAQLPEGMEHCTIKFKECEHGHGRLVATNWVDHGCHFCRIRELEAELDTSREQCQELIDATGQTCGCGYDKPSDVCLMHGGKAMACVKQGTHVIVPVEPTEKMIEAGFEVYRNLKDLWKAMIRAAAQEKADETE